MKNFLLTVAAFLLFTPLFAQQQKQMPPKADTLYKHLMAVARPAIKAWVKSTAAKYAGKDITQEQAVAEVKHAPNLGSLSDGDIMALAFLVMMEASKSAQEDLKSIMDAVKATNNAKAQQRQQAGTLKLQPGTIKVDSPRKTSLADVNKKAEADKNKKDNLDEMSEPNQMRLQLYMDRRSKLIDAISNMLKKVSDTEQQVTQNLK